MKWIRTTVVLPKNYQKVIIFIQWMDGRKSVSVASYWEYKFCEVTTNDPFLNIEQYEITHWMPLPEPPNK